VINVIGYAVGARGAGGEMSSRAAAAWESAPMSVLMTMVVQGDTERFLAFVRDEGSRLKAIADSAREQGCLHHQFGVGDGHVVVIDEWESPEQFQRFFEGNEEIEAVMQAAGAQGEPDIRFSEAIDSPDRF
jgi:heme-degrading monooxygenase HmoA